MQLGDIIFCFIFFTITTMQCSKVIHNTKNGIKYDNGLNVFHTLGIVATLMFMPSSLKGYVIVLYGIVLILLVLFVYRYQLKKGRSPDFLDTKKDFIRLILVFLIIVIVVFWGYF